MERNVITYTGCGGFAVAVIVSVAVSSVLVWAVVKIVCWLVTK